MIVRWLATKFPDSASRFLSEKLKPQVSQLQSLSCVCLAAASVEFAYNSAWLARGALVAPLLLLLWQAPVLGTAKQL